MVARKLIPSHATTQKLCHIRYDTLRYVPYEKIISHNLEVVANRLRLYLHNYLIRNLTQQQETLGKNIQNRWKSSLW